MTQLHLVKLTVTEEKEVFDSNPGDYYDHFLGTDVISERESLLLLNDEELDSFCLSVAESQSELRREHLTTLMSFASEDLNKIKRVLFGPESVIKISPSGAHSMEVPDAHFDNVPWTVRAHTNDDGQLTVFVEKGEEMLTENYSRGDDGPGWVTNYIPVVFDGHNK